MNKYDVFNKKLQQYKPFEEIASQKICNLNNVHVINRCDNYRYDFMTSDNITYEVKCDEVSRKTNNYFIEFSAYHKPSGIATTESIYYIVTDTLRYHLISVDELKKLCLKARIGKVKTNNTYGYLISCATLHQVAKEI